MNRSRIILRAAGLTLAAAAGILLFQLAGGSISYGTDSTSAGKPKASAAPTVQQQVPAQKLELPDESRFRLVTESASLKLWSDPQTAHFRVESKRTGQVWRSYPSPQTWNQETITGTWRNNLLSPVMLEYIDASNSKSQAKTVSWLEDKGVLEQYETLPDGFKAVYNFTGTAFKIPVEVRLKDDYVETRIADDKIQEGKLSLLNLKLYPLLGADIYREGQEGYLLVPDGSGALIRFKPNQSGDKTFYRENVYGKDTSFFNENTARNAIKLPVFGLKSGNQAFVGVMAAGEEFAKLVAVPNGAYGQYNWITPEWQYRTKFFQETSRNGATGFFTYSKERFTAPERVTRYYLLNPDQSGYAGMADKVRAHLIRDKRLQPLQPKGKEVPLFVDLIGADIKEGFFWDKYLKGTTTIEAEHILKTLIDRGLKHVTVHYSGWQEGGYSSHGGLFPVDKRLGGNEGMQRFIQFAHSQHIPVFLTANYTLNSNGGDGFWKNSDGLRNLAGTVQEFQNYANHEWTTIVSPKFAAGVIKKDLQEYKSLGTDGILFVEGIGRYANSDFNNNYKASRSEVVQTQKQIVKDVKETLGAVSVENSNAYTLDSVRHLHRQIDTYSYDIFIDESIPFLQMVLHGLVTYTSEWSNLREQSRTEFLRSIEYGAYPAYVFTNSPPGSMKGAYSIWYYSMDYRDWLEAAVKEYKSYNEALGDVQDRFITGHGAVAPGVKKTVYDNGQTVLVNYNKEDYTDGSVRIPGQNFIVLKGGLK